MRLSVLGAFATTTIFLGHYYISVKTQVELMTEKLC
jgi:hypothetical protein